MANAFVVINAGSTSVKFAAYAANDAGSLALVCRGQLDGIGSQPSFAAKNAKGEPVDAKTWNNERASTGKTLSSSSSRGSSAMTRVSRSLR